MIDIVHQINATHREIGDQAVATGAGRSLLLRRTYSYPIEDVWSACTDPERLSRWLGPIEGDLRVGGRFQLKDNAGGEILRCEEPRLIKVTWVLGEGMPTEVEVRLTPDDDGGTLFELEHASPAEIVDELVRTYGPGGTIGIGGGWDLTLVALGMFLNSVSFDCATWEDTPEAKKFAAASCHAWAPVVQATWGTSDDDIAAATAFAVQHYFPETAH
ncbi:SRPBCC family protein [Micromonospora fiedleri]|uniref:SRPBCC family protein n=1 Tax=Micromonospora fiedleri TaxID=1157498 RepID=A0ABS1UEQ6_9ACTN|nr:MULTISPECIES: SRPBCC family protein [Micromonospora]MBL6274837.1 SRPBCC family protein [Micromonospora fiedleri]WSK44469.1 SRPBCC family protein [Micromonospora maris]